VSDDVLGIDAVEIPSSKFDDAAFAALD